MVCSNCYHRWACGSYSKYSDATQCKQFVDEKSIVSLEVLTRVQESLERQKEDTRDLYFQKQNLEEQLAEMQEELLQLRIIKQTLEMASGLKFDFGKGD